MAWFGPGSGTQPSNVNTQSNYRQSSWIDPSSYDAITDQGLLFGQRVANLPGLGMFAVSNDPNDPLNQMVGRLPGEGPRADQAASFLSSMYGGQAPGTGMSGAGATSGGYQAPGTSGAGGGYSGPVASVHNPQSPMYKGPQVPGAGVNATGGPGAAWAGGGGAGAVANPDALRLGPNPTEAQAQNALDTARSMAFGELERANEVYSNGLGAQVAGKLTAQMNGQDPAMSDAMVGRMQAQRADQIGAAERQQQRLLREGGGLQGGVNTRAQLDIAGRGAQARGGSLNQLMLAQQQRNFDAETQARDRLQQLAGSQANTLGTMAGLKSGLLSRFEVMGDERANALERLANNFVARPPAGGGTQGFSVTGQGGQFGPGLTYGPSQVGGGIQTGGYHWDPHSDPLRGSSTQRQAEHAARLLFGQGTDPDDPLYRYRR